MPRVEISVKVDGRTVIQEAEFDQKGECIRVVDQAGSKWTLDKDGGLLKDGNPAPDAGRDQPQGQIDYLLSFQMVHTNPCCWHVIGGRWVCLPC